MVNYRRFKKTKYLICLDIWKIIVYLASFGESYKCWNAEKTRGELPKSLERKGG